MAHPTTPFSLGRLFQSPRKWTPEHLTGLNIQEHRHVPAAVIVGDANLPPDDDPGIPSPDYLPYFPII